MASSDAHALLASLSQEECLAWAAKPYPATKLNKGCLCFFCHRAWESLFSDTHSSIASFQKALGSDSDLNKKFYAIRHEGVLHFKEVGMTKAYSRSGVRVNWEVMKIKVETYLIEEVEIRKNPDQIMGRDDYEKLYGKPEENGLNHLKVVAPDGGEAWRVPGARVWDVSQLQRQGVAKTTERHTSDNAVFSNQLDAGFTNLAASMVRTFGFDQNRGAAAPSMRALLMNASGSGGPSPPRTKVPSTGGSGPATAASSSDADDGEDSDASMGPAFSTMFQPIRSQLPGGATVKPKPAAATKRAAKRPRGSSSSTEPPAARDAKRHVGRPTSNRKSVLKDPHVFAQIRLFRLRSHHSGGLGLRPRCAGRV